MKHIYQDIGNVEIEIPQRLTYLDGLKGIACIGVFWYHYYTTFLVQASSAEMHNALLRNILNDIFEYPLKIIVDGTFWVYVFALISGFLVGHKEDASQSKDDKWYADIPSVLKKLLFRYLRFSLPLLAVCIMICIIANLNLFNTVEAAETLGISSLVSVYTGEFTWGGV